MVGAAMNCSYSCAGVCRKPMCASRATCFPVVTNNFRIVVFNRIADFAARADAVFESKRTANDD